MEPDAQDLLREFRNMVKGPPDQIHLDRGSLLIARMEYPNLDHARCLAEFVRLAGRVRSRLPESPEPLKTLEVLNTVLLNEEGFRGNRGDYYDPRNSYMNEVLERKLGIPISLSVVYLEVARRLKFPLAGISFPGRFLVRHRSSAWELYVDPFQAGEFLLARDLPGRLSDVLGHQVTAEILKRNQNRLPESFVAEASTPDILRRMLLNLRGIYLRRRDLGRARRVVAFIVALDPNSREARDSMTVLRKIESALN